MNEVSFTEIAKIEIPKEDEAQIYYVIQQMNEDEARYYHYKKMVYEMDKAIEDKQFDVWVKNNPNTPVYPEAKQRRDALRSQLDASFYMVKSTINDIVRRNYPNLYEQFLNFKNLNDDIKEGYEACLLIPYHKNHIFSVLDKISDVLQGGKQLTKEESKQLADEYKEILTLLKNAYDEEYMRNSFQKNKMKQMAFMDELNLKEKLNTLTFISIVKTNVIYPILNNYQDSYNEYVKRNNFIRLYKKRLKEIRLQYMQDKQ